MLRIRLSQEIHSRTKATKRALRLVVMSGVFTCLAQAAVAAPVPCAGGTLDFAAQSDTPFVAPLFNVGQQVTLDANISGFTPDSYSWSIEGPHVKDYEERVGTVGSGAISWSTSPLLAADLTNPSVSYFWKPSPSQIHPLNGGAVSRAVSLTVTVGGTTCTATENYQVERNSTDPDKQAIDFYTSTHRAPTETNPLHGRVMDDHIQWHRDSWTRLYGFMAWHGEFLRRFNQWRQEFGYAPESAWNPGTPLPAGVEYEHFIRNPTYNPAANQIPTYYTIAGGSASFSGSPPTTATSLAEYASFSPFQNQFERNWHGVPHCNIGPWSPLWDFFAPSGPGYGSMCLASSPKDPIFWRWHGFIDLVYKNYCHVHGLGMPTCRSPADSVTDLWMGDNPPDIAANGAPPSPSPRWISPDIWNRSSEVACSAGVHPDSGVPRDCGSSADHENPVAGVENFLYATIRNDRPSPQTLAYSEVAVYIANASTGLSWPTDFDLLPNSRHFITINLAPGQSTDIGPLRWVPPDPTPSDHWCLYARALSPQDALDDSGGDEGSNVDVNTRDHNSISWRNVTVLPAGSTMMTSSFVLRNIAGEDRLALRVEVPRAFLRHAVVALILDEELARRWRGRGEGFVRVTRENQREFENLPADRSVVLSRPTAELQEFRLASRETGAITIVAQPKDETLKLESPIVLTQVSPNGIDGGITIMPQGTDAAKRR